MEDIKILKNIELANPVMIAGWPGMGTVALGVVDYLRRKLGATKFAEIELDPLATIDSVLVEDGVATIPPIPKNIFYYVRNPDIIILEGEAQLSGQAGLALLGKVLDVAERFKVRTIYTGAAFPMPISHREDPEVYGAVNRRDLLDVLQKFDIKAMEGGHISGMNGLILGLARQRNIDAVCLLATMPQYAISLPNPKASAAIIDVMQKMLSFVVSLEELYEYIKDMDEKMAVIEEKVKDVLTIENEKEAQPPADKKVPGYITDKIERLFKEAEKDKSKAIILKRELDRWDLYKIYEDRFLDLFKDSQ
ncbi:MAG: PAC2 family protein [Candidatus Omnitrophica bacterium]|nr:PAC2 family protein [Candidatus Omnitrophota bacterium]MCM8790177.1 PAC2 family protein [Candidatus Omnitrophota bacterium]